MAKLNRTCFLCGKKYSYCPNCDRDRLKPSWNGLFDSEICKELDEILANNTAKKITDEEAKALIEKLDIIGLEIVDEDIKANIKRILDTVVKVETKKVEETKTTKTTTKKK